MADPTLWSVFVGDNGDQLEVFNSVEGPFPPEPDREGYIAIGWPAVGDMRVYTTGSAPCSSYACFVEHFRTIYGPNYEREQAFKAAANMIWNFAAKMKEGDWVMCPSSATGWMLIGEVAGPYETDFHLGSRFYGMRRIDLVHLRRVRWRHAIGADDPRYKQLNRVGQLTLAQPKNIDIDEVREMF